MRWLKYLFLAAVALVLVVLSLANREFVTVETLPPGLAAWAGWTYAIELPLFLVILLSVIAGLLIGFVWEWFREHRHRAEASRQRRARAKLEHEVQTLKGRANEGRDDVLALLDDGTRTG
ncbi:DUF1049 domain-containing protein [Rhodobacterales bacterium HKCCE2091]|nr:DUF1049 domain-containing protein [Rhodobacterales bacterium HKCCE2091]